VHIWTVNDPWERTVAKRATGAPRNRRGVCGLADTSVGSVDRRNEKILEKKTGEEKTQNRNRCTTVEV